MIVDLADGSSRAFFGQRGLPVGHASMFRPVHGIAATVGAGLVAGLHKAP
jgi:hypothetical protein